MNVSGPFARLPAPPHVTDVSSSLLVTSHWFVGSFILCCYCPLQNIVAYLCVLHEACSFAHARVHRCIECMKISLKLSKLIFMN